MAYLDYICQDCGQTHLNGGEALACDHERGNEQWHRLVGGLHANGTVPGCPLCPAVARRLARKEAGQAAEVER
jgi:hypothetical protein